MNPEPTPVVRVRGARLEAVYAWFFAPHEAPALPLARLLIGAALFLHYARLLPHVDFLYFSEGLNGAALYARHPGLVSLDPHRLAKFDFLRFIPHDWVIAGLYGALLGCALAFTVGSWTRTTGLVLALLHMVFFGHVPGVRGGWLAVVHAFVIYLVIADAGRRFSLDAVRRGRLVGVSQPPALGVRLIQLHVCAIYLVAGWERLDAPAWLSGQMVTLTVVNSRFSRFALDWQTLQPLLEAMNAAAYVLEPAAPILLWVPRLRVLVALALISMHAGLELLADLGFWQWLMIAGLSLFLPGSWFQRAGDWLSQLARRRPSALLAPLRGTRSRR